MTVREAVPPVFGTFFHGLEEQAQTGAAGDLFHRCFGCGPAHPAGLHVRCFRTPDGVASPIVIPRQYEGPPGAAHGGIVAAYLDEVLAGAAARASGRSSITGELTVRFQRPVPLEAPILGRGLVLHDHARYLDVEGRLEAFPGGTVLATARGRFFPRGTPPGG
jgi:acyl-coenzyme A thioesterase PaaI-like protein